MNIVFAALMTVLLALPAGRELRLCQHHSGTTHVLRGSNSCDGEHGHSKSRDHYNHEHHEARGAHHEPCEHYTISNGDDLTSRLNKLYFTNFFITQFPPFEDLSFGEWHPQITDKQKLYVMRGQPGDGGPQGHFHATIRLLI